MEFWNDNENIGIEFGITLKQFFNLHVIKDVWIYYRFENNLYEIVFELWKF